MRVERGVTSHSHGVDRPVMALTFSVLMRKTNSGAFPSGAMTAESWVLTTFSDPEKLDTYTNVYLHSFVVIW